VSEGHGLKPRAVELPDGRVWLRVADPEWTDPLDDTWAQERGGRWNPPASHRTLYLNADPETARLQIEALLEGSPVDPEDLDDDAYLLVAVTLPRSQTVADGVTDRGLRALGLPATYPVDASGDPVPHAVCRTMGREVKRLGLRGVACRSAASRDGRGTELAWFPATRRSRAHPVWPEGKPYGSWRGGAGWGALGLAEQERLPPST